MRHQSKWKVSLQLKWMYIYWVLVLKSFQSLQGLKYSLGLSEWQGLIQVTEDNFSRMWNFLTFDIVLFKICPHSFFYYICTIFCFSLNFLHANICFVWANEIKFQFICVWVGMLFVSWVPVISPHTNPDILGAFSQHKIVYHLYCPYLFWLSTKKVRCL